MIEQLQLHELTLVGAGLLFLGLLLGAGLAALLLGSSNRRALQSLEEQVLEVEQKNHDLESKLAGQQSRAEIAEREQYVATDRLAQSEKHFNSQLALLNDARASLLKEFENLANRIFESKNQQFNQQSQAALKTNIEPLREQLKDFRKKVEDVYVKENADRNRLAGQIGELQKQTQKISDDAINLARALKGDNKAQGNWGEVILERLLEESGLQKGREYETQVSLQSEGGQRRAPDVIVRLPENKDIIIDAKVSLLDYERYCSADDEDERAQFLKQHIQSLRAHISGLSIKDYEKLEGIRSLDFVFIFMPIEAAFMLALQHEPSLYKEAYDKHIILVSPTTLLATLRTVEGIWRYEKQNKNAEKIAKQAGGLYDQFVLLLDAVDDLGKSLDKTQTSYNSLHKRLKTGRGNLVKRVEDIKTLGAKTKKSIAPKTLEEADALDAIEASGAAAELDLLPEDSEKA